MAAAIGRPGQRLCAGEGGSSGGSGSPQEAGAERCPQTLQPFPTRSEHPPRPRADVGEVRVSLPQLRRQGRPEEAAPRPQTACEPAAGGAAEFSPLHPLLFFFFNFSVFLSFRGGNLPEPQAGVGHILVEVMKPRL